VGLPPNLHAGGVSNEQKCFVRFDSRLNPADRTPGYRLRQHNRKSQYKFKFDASCQWLAGATSNSTASQPIDTDRKRIASSATDAPSACSTRARCQWIAGTTSDSANDGIRLNSASESNGIRAASS
jgi:hypothetical protein